MKRLLSRVVANLRDVGIFGVSILGRFSARLRSRPTFAVDVPEYGRIHLRTDTMDLDLARVVLVEGAYNVPWPTEGRERLERRYRSIVNSGGRPVIVNAGGYIGLSALWFAREWPAAEIVSVEPDPGNLVMLRQNLEGRRGHTIIEAALGCGHGRAIILNGDEGCAIRTERAEAGVEIVTVDDAVARVPSGEPFICNIDIEGFEKDLFAANTSWIDRFALVIIEPHDWREPGAVLSGNFRREMAARPYDMFTRDGSLFYLHI
jgi:FkbM family methyltransferase